MRLNRIDVNPARYGDQRTAIALPADLDIAQVAAVVEAICRVLGESVPVLVNGVGSGAALVDRLKGAGFNVREVSPWINPGLPYGFPKTPF